MKLHPDHRFYATWDSTINPAHFIYKTFGTAASHVEDQRVYKDELIEWLLSPAQAGVLIERYKRIDEDGNEVPKQDNDDDSGIPGWKIDGDHGTALIRYQDHLIFCNQTSEGWTVTDWFSTGQESLISRFKGYLAEDKGAKVSIVLQANSNLYTKAVDFHPPIIDDLELNYGGGFQETHDTIVRKLRQNKAGMIIFYSEPGQGKSVYIKYLTTLIDREFIYVPVGLAGELASPAFISLLMEHKDAVIILEDAEQAMQSREIDTHNASVVSVLLNLSDGILGTILNTTIIVTCNFDKNLIDKALLRPGRLIFNHHFSKLSAKEAQRLAKHLGKNNPENFQEPASLAEVYNADDKTGYKEIPKKTMGFGATMVTPKP